MSRAGFDTQRLRNVGLDAPGLAPLPAVSRGAGVADQVREVLAAAGRAAYTAAAVSAEQRRAEDQQNIGAARLQSDKDLAPLAQRVQETVLERARSGEGLDDESLNALVDETVSGGVAGLGLNEAGVERYRLDLTGRLNQVAFAARESAAEKARADAIADLSQSFATVQSPDDFQSIAESIKQIDPRVSDQDIEAYAMPAMQAAARTGDRATFEALAQKIGDSPETKIARIQLSQYERQQEALAEQESIEAVRRGIEALESTGNYAGALALLENSDVPVQVRRSERGRLESAREAMIAREQDEATTQFLNDLFTYGAAGDADAFGTATQQAITDGLIEPKDIPPLNARFAAQLSQRLEAEAQTAILDLQNASTETDRVNAFGKVTGILDAAETALRVPQDHAGSITQNQYSSIVSVADPILRQMFAEEFRQRETLRLLEQSDTPTGAVFNTTTIGGDTWTAKEQAAEVADAKWQMLQQSVARTEADPFAPEREMVDWLSRNPQATVPQWENENQGFMGRMVGAVSNPDEPERLEAVKGQLVKTMAMLQANPDVATRHMPENMVQALDYIKLLGDLIPLEDDALLGTAMRAVAMRDGPVDRYRPSQSEIDDYLIPALRKAGFSDDLLNFRNELLPEAKARAEALASLPGIGGRYEDAAKAVAEAFRANWQTSDNWAVRTSNLGRTGSFDYELVKQVAEGVYRRDTGYEGPLVMRRDYLGRLALYEPGAYSPIEDSPAFTGREIEGIMSAYTSTSTAIAERRGRSEASMAMLREQAGQMLPDWALGDQTDPTLRGPLEIVESVAQMITARSLNNAAKEISEDFARQLVAENVRGANKWEKYAIELNRPARPSPDPVAQRGTTPGLIP